MQRKDEILAKLEQVREQAQLTLDELPLRLELSAAAAEHAAKPPSAAPRA